ncbi:hypothetical protein [Streptomyces sp. NPDC001508]|uniref:hypothetical protein n=1 Tax=Streptomyces sp. NPDC001508 TaxID=3154656 RepID=UPI003331D652
MDRPSTRRCPDLTTHRIRVGIDVGGNFTDAVADDATTLHSAPWAMTACSASARTARICS